MVTLDQCSDRKIYKIVTFILCITIFLFQTFYVSLYQNIISGLFKAKNLSQETFDKITLGLTCISAIIPILVFVIAHPRRRKILICLSATVIGCTSASLGFLLKTSHSNEGFLVSIMVIRTVCLCAVCLLWSASLPTLISLKPCRTGLICAIAGFVFHYLDYNPILVTRSAHSRHIAEKQTAITSQIRTL